jgi:peptidoglycan/LPS O-acetylase OafA/YrhL
MPFTPRGEPAGEALGFAAIGLNCAFAATWPTMGQSWSLTCEIVYYALAPVFRVFNWVPWAFLVMSALYFTKSPLMGWWDYPTWAVAPCLMWMWLAGWIYYGLRKTAPGYVFLAIVLACIQLVHKIEPGTFAPLTLIITGIGFFAADRWHLPAKAARVCDWLGSVSYPLYLSHLTTCALLYYTAPAWWPHHPYLYVVAAFVVAVAIKQLIEDPVHKIMKPRRRTDEPRLGSDKPDRKATALSII